MLKGYQYDKELTTLCKAVKNAYKKVIKGTKMDVKDKGSRDLVTNLDIASEAYLLNIIKTYFPNDTIISEENNPTVTPKGRTWTVDPIDGTINFANGSKLWGLQVSFSVDGEIEFGIIYIPEYKDFVYGAKGFGAYKNGKKLVIDIDNSKPQLVAVDYSKDINRFFFENEKSIEKYTLRIRSFGVGCFGFYSVAYSQVGTYILACSNPWDLYPGIIICKEAGANVYQKFIDGEKVTFVTTNDKFASKLDFKKKDLI